MSQDIFFFIVPVLLVLFLFAIPVTRKLLRNFITELVAACGGYVFTLADIKSESNNLLLFNYSWKELDDLLIIIAALLTIIAIFISAHEKRKRKEYSDLEKELDKCNQKMKRIKEEYFKLCSDTIKESFNSFYETTSGNGRVSIYKHNGSCFTLLGRYSNNPVYNSRGEEIYPDDEGFIAFGWQNQSFYIHSIPKWVGNGTDYKTYVKKHCRINEQRLKSLTMKSRSFYVQRVDSKDSSNPLGIVVFEKIDDTIISKLLVDQIFEIHEGRIFSLLKSMNTLEA